MLTASAALGMLTAVLASLLGLAHRVLQVLEDPRIDQVEDMLPHANCGACGYPGCRPFAEALVRREALPGKCTVSAEAGRQRIAAFLGVEVGAGERRVARLACAGGNHVARNRARYQGLSSCAAAALVGGGGKGCAWACLGLGDCVRVCGFDALALDAHALPVVNEARCTACGKCVTACPKDLFSMHPVSHRLWVACSSHLQGEAALLDCEVACDGCGRCAMDAPAGRIRMRHHLPLIQHDGPPLSAAPAQRCPSGAIVWIDESGRILKGAAAKKILRTEPRPHAPT